MGSSGRSLLTLGSGTPAAVGLVGAAGSAVLAALFDHVHAGQALIGCQAYANANQSLPNNTLTALALNLERFDTDSMHDNVTNNSRLVVNTAGKYLIAGIANLAAAASGYFQLDITVNGTTIGSVLNMLNSGTSITLAAFSLWDCGLTQYIELQAKQNSGGALNSQYLASYAPQLIAIRVGA